jgi:hypothetical protein
MLRQLMTRLCYLFSWLSAMNLAGQMSVFSYEPKPPHLRGE